MRTFNQFVLHEGLYDPGIFHAFFLDGGPASGKSAASFKVTGSRSNSFTRKKGERLVNVSVGKTGPMGLKIINSDEMVEKLVTDASMHTEMDKYSPEEETQKNELRKRAKIFMAAKQKNFITGRLGIVIDGTGKDYDRLITKSNKLRGLGYETTMIFVDTSLNVAIERNNKRGRTLDLSVVTEAWELVQQEQQRYRSYFGRNNFVMIPNDKEWDQDMTKEMWNAIQKIAKRSVDNPIANAWKAYQLRLKQAERGL